MVKVLFYLQHLLGIGHVNRSALIIKELCEHDFEVHVAFGGSPVSGTNFAAATLHQLLPIKSADGSFSALVTADGSPLTEEKKEQRRDELLALAEEIQPDIIVTESYPFGRRMMRFELLPLLHWAQQQKPKPMVVSSIRDILQRKRAEREAETVEIVKKFYDHIWFHGDETFCPLEASFPMAAQISEKFGGTGYVAAAPPPMVAKRGGVVVSIGGGAVGLHLLQTAIELACSGFMVDRKWTILAGLNQPQEFFHQLQEKAPENVSILRHVNNFPARLAGAELSVSMAGYNTVMDILQAKVPAVLIPFEGAGETEQLMRTEKLAEAGRAVCLRESEVTATALALAMEKALTIEIGRLPINTDGAKRSAEQLMNWWESYGKLA